jgi:hypothetical protein
MATAQITKTQLLTNPLNGKTYKSVGNLLRSLSVFMDGQSTLYYKYMITPRKKCATCFADISFDEIIDKPGRSRCSACYYTEDGKLRRFVSEETLLIRGAKIREKKLEFAQTDYGKEVYKNIGAHNSQHLKKHFKTDIGKEQIKNAAVKQSITMKKKIASGEFTPNITNSWTNWDAIIHLDNGVSKKFRSSWEACFWYSNQNLEYETMRIPYLSEIFEPHVYIADFFDASSNTVYELKPKQFWFTQNKKMQEVINYCLKNNINFVWINEYNIMKYIKKDIFFGENLKQLEKMMSGAIHYDEIENQKH